MGAVLVSGAALVSGAESVTLSLLEHPRLASYMVFWPLVGRFISFLPQPPVLLSL